MRPRALRVFCSLLTLQALPAVAAAQVRASERGTVSQTVDGTTISLDYSRPVARGRSPLFGGVVHWDGVWTPGANWATTLETDRDIRLNGQVVERGRYSVWMIPRESGAWSVLLVGNAHLFHTQHPDPKTAKLTLMVMPQQGPATEVLTWSFPQVSREGATLTMQWGTTVIPLEIAVTPWTPAVAPGVDLAPYAGEYRVRFEGEGSPPVAIGMELSVQYGLLHGRWSQSPPDFDADFDMFPSQTDKQTFTARYYKDGKVYEVDEETLVVFQLDRDKVTGFEMRFNGDVYARAERVK